LSGRWLWKAALAVVCLLGVAALTVDYFTSREVRREYRESAAEQAAASAGGAAPASFDGRMARIRATILLSTLLGFLPAVAVAALAALRMSRRFRATMKRKVEQFEREHAELERVERVRKDFVINVSHELRTPLASIQGYTETLLDGALSDPENNVRFLKIIRHNAERLARITEDLLTLSRIEQKRQKFEFEPHPVESLLEEALDLMRPIAERSRIALELSPPAAAAEAWCDGEAVSQILSNLLDNAIKYTPAGGRITIGATPGDKFVELWVRDTGIGIPPEELPRLFERFYRVDKARSRELGGTGLGLSIVKHLVAAHGGSARVESRLNEGSTFYFTLPCAEAARRGEPDAEFTAS